MSYKKEIIIGLVILAIAGGVTFNYSLNAKNEIVLPNTVFATIEALANDENGNDNDEPCYKGQYNSSLPLAVTCATPCTSDRKAGSTDVCPRP